MKACLLFLVFLSFLPGRGLSQSRTIKDSSPTFESGQEDLNRLIASHLRYPPKAVYAGIEGTVRVRVEVDADGTIDPTSTVVQHSVHPLLDDEALRIVKSLFNARWKPGIKHGKAVAESVVIPVAFSLADVLSNDESSPFAKSVWSTVGEKVGRSQAANEWNVFNSPLGDGVWGKVVPGDSILIVGWAPWRFRVITDRLSGYISWKAVRTDPVIDSLSNIIAAKSESELLRFETRRDSLRDADPLKAELSLSTYVKSVSLGECFVAPLAFNLDMNNMVEVRWRDDLSGQLANIIAAADVHWCWYYPHVQEAIVVNYHSSSGTSVTSYPLAQLVYCPTETGIVQIPAVNLIMQGKKGPLTFISSPQFVSVLAAPAESLSGTIVGDFSIYDSLSGTPVVGEQVNYEITAKGFGSLFTVEAPAINIADVDARLNEIKYSGNVDVGKFWSEKKWRYTLTFKRPGRFNFSQIPVFHFYKKDQSKNITAFLSQNIDVASSPGKSEFESDSKLFRDYVLMDVSTSMQLTDLTPSRGETMVTGVARFFNQYSMCDIGVATFDSDMRITDVSSNEGCYDESHLLALYSAKSNKPSAIVTALRHLMEFKSPEVSMRIVLIGDGDNSLGFASFKLLADMARERRVIIHCIGVGTPGAMEFKDGTGKVRLVENTFNDANLKFLAAETGGTYRHATDDAAVFAALKRIFQ